MIQHDKVTYASPEEQKASDALAGCTAELVENWMKNNKESRPHVIIHALALLLSYTIARAPSPDLRDMAVVSALHTILGETDCDHQRVLRDLAVLTAGNARDGGFDA